MIEYFEDTVADIVVVGILAFVSFQCLDGGDSQRQEENLVQSLQHQLADHLADEFPPAQHAQEGDREKGASRRINSPLIKTLRFVDTTRFL